MKSIGSFLFIFAFASASSTMAAQEITGESWTNAPSGAAWVSEMGKKPYKDSGSIIAVCAGSLRTIQTKIYNRDSFTLGSYRPRDIKISVDDKPIPIDQSVMKLGPGSNEKMNWSHWYIDGTDNALVKAILSGGKILTVSTIFGYGPNESLDAVYTLKNARNSMSQLIRNCK